MDSSVITLGALNDTPAIRHGFMTRAGGVSVGIYGSLNCGLGSNDDPANVAENRRRCAARFDLDAERLVTLYQVHSPDVVTVERPWLRGGDQPRADAMVTATPGIALGILTADCVPVLLADMAAKVVGAAHAGWKGAKGGVVDATVAAMVALGARPERIVAGIGPCIAQYSYEVGPEFPDRFLAEDGANADFFVPAQRAGHSMFDIGGYVARRLERSGVGTVQRCPNDTVTEEDSFFSYRRATLRAENDYGRGISIIMLRD
jgi:YfiH family protein